MIRVFHLFQKLDKDLYQTLMQKNEVEFYDFLVETEKSFLKKKTKTVHKALLEKGWNVYYLMDCAANRALLEMAQATNAEIVKVKI